MNWIVSHWEDVLAVIGAAAVLGWSLVKLTPNKTDDAFMAKVQKVLDLIGLRK